MKIFVTGGTGFVGSHLSVHLAREGHEVTVLTRSLRGSEKKVPGISYLQGDPAQKGPWQGAVGQHDVIINLAGATIFRRWSEKYKKIVRDSRIQTTANLIEAMDGQGGRKITFFSTSAVGYYGFHGDEELTEESPPGEDFLARLAVDWEQEASRAAAKGARVVIARFGIVLGEKGGALGQMIPLFKWFLGGPIGNGKQWFSWIHMQDLVAAFSFLLKNEAITGPVNLCSPHPVRNRELARALGEVLHRPSFLCAPGFMIRLILGEFGSVILKGQRVFPKRLAEQGFTFQYGEIKKALQSLVY